LIVPGVNGKKSNHQIQQPQPTITTVDHESNTADEISDMPQLNPQGVSVIPKTTPYYNDDPCHENHSDIGD
jgi:hypothetical protein